MSLYNLTGLEQSETLADLIYVANDGSGGIFIVGFVISVFAIITMTLAIKTSMDNAMLGSSFICFWLTMFFRQAGLIEFWYVIGFLVLLGLISLKKAMGR